MLHLFLFCAFKRHVEFVASRMVARTDEKFIGHALLPPEDTSEKRMLCVFHGFEIF